MGCIFCLYYSTVIPFSINCELIITFILYVFLEMGEQEVIFGGVNSNTD